MAATRVMVIAGEPSGDLLAAELLNDLRAVLKERGLASDFFGAGGSKMREAGVELAFDMTKHAVVGLVEVLRNYGKFKRLFRVLLDMAVERRPDILVCVDFGGFNRRFAHAVRRASRSVAGWSPKIVQYVSPQVWASRERRARKMARDFDLLLAIFPFEPAWYAQRVPSFKVEFVGHPMFERHRAWSERIAAKSIAPKSPASVVLLPGSRVGELRRHLPVLAEASREIASSQPVRFHLVVPSEALLEYAKSFLPRDMPIELRVGGLAGSLIEADLALASTGTVTLECAFFKVPTVAFYKTSWSTYQIGKRIVKVKFLAMPNILADEMVFPEFVQHEANAENIARAALTMLRDAEKRQHVETRLTQVIDSLRSEGGKRRAAEAVAGVLNR
jgi:lipid-A-disaccharide synthase